VIGASELSDDDDGKNDGLKWRLIRQLIRFAHSFFIAKAEARGQPWNRVEVPFHTRRSVYYTVASTPIIFCLETTKYSFQPHCGCTSGLPTVFIAVQFFTRMSFSQIEK
jgi:hypothetical protein